MKNLYYLYYKIIWFYFVYICSYIILSNINKIHKELIKKKLYIFNDKKKLINYNIFFFIK